MHAIARRGPAVWPVVEDGRWPLAAGHCRSLPPIGAAQANRTARRTVLEVGCA
jgi:hypothetical protein